jgi:hypothetical protein
MLHTLALGVNTAPLSDEVLALIVLGVIAVGLLMAALGIYISNKYNA